VVAELDSSGRYSSVNPGVVEFGDRSGAGWRGRAGRRGRSGLGRRGSPSRRPVAVPVVVAELDSSGRYSSV